MSMSDNYTLEKAVPTALSPSSASTFSQCPQRWKFRYIDRLPDPPGRSALLGTFAHAVLEHLFQEQPESRTKEKAKSIASALWPETDSDPDFIALGLDDQEKTAFKRDCMSAFNGVWEIDKYKPETVDVESTELNVQVQLGDVPFRGIIDLVHREDGNLIISDFKSGKAPKTAKDEDEKMKQVLLYAAALREKTDEHIEKVRLVFIGNSTNKDYERVVTEELMHEPVSELHDTWGEIQTSCQSGSFETKTGPLCEWCPYVDRCIDGVNQVIQRFNAGRIRDDAPAMKIFGWTGKAITQVAE
tara:strand:- start:2804 stop:3706 length:903 start_codon:yes stop_codon:yes gene_type:complete